VIDTGKATAAGDPTDGVAVPAGEDAGFVVAVSAHAPADRSRTRSRTPNRVRAGLTRVSFRAKDDP
jgi:hypothetical protein